MTSTHRTHWSPSPHPELVTLAELDESLLDPPTAGQVAEHLAGCAACRARRAALTDVPHLLRDAGEVLPIPGDVARTLDAALAAAATPSATAAADTVTPVGHRRRTPWNTHVLQAAAVAVLLLLLGGLGYSAILSNHHDRSGGERAAGRAQPEGASQVASGSTGSGAYPVTESGRDYTKDSLRAAVPSLLLGGTGAGTRAPRPRAATDGLGPSRLLGGSPLAACVANLAGGPVTPLAVDVARFEGKPATVIVLPTQSDATTVDAYVVAPDCPAGTFLTFERVARR